MPHLRMPGPSQPVRAHSQLSTEFLTPSHASSFFAAFGSPEAIAFSALGRALCRPSSRMCKARRAGAWPRSPAFAARDPRRDWCARSDATWLSQELHHVGRCWTQQQGNDPPTPWVVCDPYSVVAFDAIMVYAYIVTVVLALRAVLRSIK